MAIPVSLDEAKRQLRLEVDDISQDAEILGFIADAAAWVENYTGHVFTAQTVTETFRGFKPVNLRAWPIKADAVPAVAYSDTAGTAIGVPGARLDLSRDRARVMPGTGSFWPFIDSQQVFTVTIDAGYAAGDHVPGNLKRAMLLLIAAYEVDREGGDILAKAEASARSLCSDYRPRAL